MALRMMDEGSERILNAIFGNYDTTTAPIEAAIALFSNTLDFGLVGGAVVGHHISDAFDLLAFDFCQYAAGGGDVLDTGVNPMNVTLNFTDAIAQTVGAGIIMEVQWAAITFQFSGALAAAAPSAKGYVVYDSNTTNGEVVFFAENFLNPYTPLEAGETIIVHPRFRLGNGTPF